jgi:hypothetical protein
MCARAKKAAENYRQILKMPCSVRCSDFVLLFLTLGFLLRCGDVESNPGPDSNMETTSTTENQGNGNSVSLSDIASKLHIIMNEQSDMKRTINERFGMMEERLKGRLDDIDSRIQTTNDDIDALSEKVDCLQRENVNLKKQVTDQDSKLDYMENQSRRQNLVFHNIPKEKNNETWEDCEWAVQDVLRDVLGAGVKVAIDRAHRVGSAIIVRFQNFKDKERILRLGYMFKGTNIGVSEDFSKQVREKRKGLIPLMKTYHKDKKRATLVMDKLRTPDGVYTFDTTSQQIQQVESAGPQQTGARGQHVAPAREPSHQRTLRNVGETTTKEDKGRRDRNTATMNWPTQNDFAQQERRRGQETPLQRTRDNLDSNYRDRRDSYDSQQTRARPRGFGRGLISPQHRDNNATGFSFFNNMGRSRGGEQRRGRGRGSPRGGGHGEGPSGWR